MKVPETSLEAYRSIDIKTLSEIYHDILKSLGILGEATFEEISANLRIDKSRVWKRMSELERMELVYRPGNKRLLKSGRNGYTWMLRTAATVKTEEQAKEVRYKPDVPNAADYASNIISKTLTPVIQQQLF